jgi:hypothetical protein
MMNIRVTIEVPQQSDMPTGARDISGLVPHLHLRSVLGSEMTSHFIVELQVIFLSPLQAARNYHMERLSSF